MRALIVDDEETQRILLQRHLNAVGYEAETAENAEAALNAMRDFPVDLVVTDIRMPGEMDGRGLLAKIREMDPDLPVIVMTAYSNLQDAVDLLTQQGAFYYIEKPIDDIGLLERVMARAVENRWQKAPPSNADENIFEGMVGDSEPMRQLRQEMKRLLPFLGGPATVLLTGESGSGKDLVARLLHQHGLRQSGPFVPVNCGAIPVSLMESELFGSVKGAFTGAEEARVGFFEAADGGTIFLDEIAEIPLETQAKFLRVLDNREFSRVGASSPQTVDACVIAATNQDLEAYVKENRFREDLYYRLNALRIHVPPLRERREDIPALCQFLIDRFTKASKLPPKSIEEDALTALRRITWPGNVRQLDHYLRQALVMSDSEAIRLEDLPAERAASGFQEEPSFLREALEREMSLNDIEREILIAALDHAEGNITAAAEMLGVTRRKFRYRMDKHNLDVPNGNGGDAEHDS